MSVLPWTENRTQSLTQNLSLPVPYSPHLPTGSAYFHFQDGVETPTSPEGFLSPPPTVG